MSRHVPLSVLDQVSVASPCNVSWDAMSGDDRSRHCEHCGLNVYNLSGMTAQEAADFVSGHEGRLCIRFYRRADGTMLTQDCPVGLAAIRRRVRRAAGRIAAGVVLLLGGALLAGLGRNPLRARRFEPFASVCSWLAPLPPQLPPPSRFTMGARAAPWPRPRPAQGGN